MATVFDPPSNEEKKEFERLKGLLFKLCDSNNIKYSVDSEDGAIFGFDTSVTVKVPCGATPKAVFLWDVEDIQQFLNVGIENISLLPDRIGILDRKKSTIEAKIRYLGSKKFEETAFYKLISDKELQKTAKGTSKESIKLKHVPVDGIIDGLALRFSLGPISHELHILEKSYGKDLISLRIRGIPDVTLEQAYLLLEKVAGSLFFQIDTLCDTPLALLERIPARRKSKRLFDEELSLSFPRLEYDQAPLSLFTYGRGSSGIPLLQFLAFYQVVEFYFPTCFQAELKRRIQTLMKDPGFRPDRDTDIAKILALTQSSTGPSRTGERAMLQATLSEAVSVSDLEAFIEENPEAKAFYGAKKNPLTTKRIVLDGEVDLRQQVADRMYDIRCKIVHTKSTEAETDQILLPFSKESNLLHYDIDMMQFLAHKLLVYSSSAITLPFPTKSP